MGLACRGCQCGTILLNHYVGVVENFRFRCLISKSCHSKTVSTFLCEFVQKTNFNSLGSTDERDLVATLITWGNLWRTDAFISRSFSHMSCCLYLQMSKIFPKISDNGLEGVKMTHWEIIRFWKVAWIWSHYLQLQWKFKWLAGKFASGVKAKHYWALSTNFWKQKVCWHNPAMFCPIISSKLSRQSFEFSLKVKVIGLNLSYLLKSFLLWHL